jgi:hypothetical protein
MTFQFFSKASLIFSCVISIGAGSVSAGMGEPQARSFSFFKRVTVSAFHPITRGERCFALIALPDFMVEWLAGLPAQGMFLEDVPFVIAIQLDEARFLLRVKPVGEDD